jgi:hypothetical protein
VLGTVFGQPCRLVPPALPEQGLDIPFFVVSVVDVGASADCAHGFVAAYHGPERTVAPDIFSTYKSEPKQISDYSDAKGTRDIP